jgi:acetoacetyl-CoA synthetase
MDSAVEPALEPRVLWRPSPEWTERTALLRFQRWVEAEHGVALPDYGALWEWSVADLERFWPAIATFFDVPFTQPPERVLPNRTMPGASWFEGATLNAAEAFLRSGADDDVALWQASETRPLSPLTRGALRAQVARIAAALSALGVGEGDRVVAYMPNIAETVAAFLATASLGAIWSSAPPEFGPEAVVDRFGQIEPSVLLTVDGYRYGGKDVQRRDAVAALLERLPSVRHTVLLPYLDRGASASGLRSGITWGEFEALGAGAGPSPAFRPVGFDHPLWVLFSSGTTGIPKAIVHGHGGIVLELTKSLHLQVDARRGDRLFWFTTTGWMMWNFLVGGLLTEAEIVLFDGSPGHPDVGSLWRFAAEAGVTIFGTSAAYIGASSQAGVRPRSEADLSAVRAVGSTGSPLPPEDFEWIYENVGDVWLFSMSGGTELCTAFIGGVPTLPVVRGEIQARALGAAVEVWSPGGEPIVDALGELVLTAPMPSMPLSFWNDPDGRRYRASYFDTWPGVWRHGDWATLTHRGSLIVAGRSDATINRGGVRFGASEIYRAVSSVEAVLDALVVDVPLPGTAGFMPLFVVLDDGVVLDDALVGEIRKAIRERCSPRHVPDEVVQVPAVPRTLSGKKLEVPVKRILMGEPSATATSVEALADPGSLAFFESYAARLARHEPRAEGGRPPAVTPPSTTKSPPVE